jgi:hypothetical protein
MAYFFEIFVFVALVSGAVLGGVAFDALCFGFGCFIVGFVHHDGNHVF